jgi:hypothetical protein
MKYLHEDNYFCKIGIVLRVAQNEWGRDIFTTYDQGYLYEQHHKIGKDRRTVKTATHVPM